MIVQTFEELKSQKKKEGYQQSPSFLKEIIFKKFLDLEQGEEEKEEENEEKEK